MLQKRFSLEGRVALVTGATRGLGLEIAKGLAEAGADVGINGRSEESVGRAVAAAQEYGRAFPVVADVSDTSAMQGALAEVADRFGRLDILVNNVGLRDRRQMAAFSHDDIRTLLDANLIAPFELSRGAAEGMIRNGWGRIINITSIAGPVARAGDAIYTMSKGGLAALTRALAAELGPHGITVNGIAPGFFATEANAGLVADSRVEGWIRKRAALKRWGDPEEIAGAAVFLASEAASYVTGQIVTVDGGVTALF